MHQFCFSNHKFDFVFTKQFLPFNLIFIFPFQVDQSIIFFIKSCWNNLVQGFLIDQLIIHKIQFFIINLFSFLSLVCFCIDLFDLLLSFIRIFISIEFRNDRLQIVQLFYLFVVFKLLFIWILNLIINQFQLLNYLQLIFVFHLKLFFYVNYYFLVLKVITMDLCLHELPIHLFFVRLILNHLLLL